MQQWKQILLSLQSKFHSKLTLLDIGTDGAELRQQIVSPPPMQIHLLTFPKRLLMYICTAASVDSLRVSHVVEH